VLYAQINKKGRKELDQALQQAQQAKWYRRLKVIDLSSQGQSVPVLAQLFDLNQQTVRTYINRYNDGGLRQLRPKYGSGRTAKINLTKEELAEVLHRSPSQFTKLKSGARNWNQKLLQQYLQRYHQIKVSQAAISDTLKRLGIHWNQAKKKVTSPDPLYTVKRQRLENLKHKAHQGQLSSHDATRPHLDQPAKPANLAFFDSTDLHWCPEVSYSYVSQGQQLKVETPGTQNPWSALFGSLIYPSGEGLYTIHHRKRQQEVQAHLQHLIDTDPEVFWFVVLDNASAHTTPQLDAFARQHQDRLELVFLPTYSPQLNLIERLWKLMRAQVTNNQFFDHLGLLAQAVVDWLEKLPFDQFCSLMGLDPASCSVTT
jgi:transposase